MTISTIQPQAGDLILVERKAAISSLIRFGQGLRDREYKWATHAGILVSDTEIVEALGHGVARSPLSKYDGIPHAIVHTEMPPEVRQRVVEFALHAVGRKYGYTEIATLGLYLLTGTRWRMAFDNQLICSALAAEALSRNEIFPFEPLWAMPADLAKFYRVTREAAHA